MGMKVTKRADLLRKLKAEEEARRFARAYEGETLEAVALDLFLALVTLTAKTLEGVEYSEEIHGEILAQMRGFAARLEAQGIEIEIS